MGSNRRTYGEAELRQLSFNRQGRERPFSVDEVRSLMSLSADPDRSCAEVGSIAPRHLVSVEERIARLERLRVELRRATRACEGRRIADCRVIEAIAGHRSDAVGE